jgi:hypothetical protein
MVMGIFICIKLKNGTNLIFKHDKVEVEDIQGCRVLTKNASITDMSQNSSEGIG